jgi:signal transduction histidine kinase
MPPELGAYRGLLRDLGVASALCVPLRARRRTLGVFSFLAADPRRTFTPADLAFARDLAHRAALALDHARLHRSTRQALRARDDFLAAASHELRTPLSHIKGFVSSLRQTDVAWDDATRQDFLAEIERESDRLALLIDDLLDLSRLERVGPDRAPVRPAALIAAAIDHVRGALSAHPITLDVADDLPSVPVDAHQIERVLSNLLDNAAKYSPAGAPIHVSAALRHNLLEIAVEDRGPGVPENLRSRIFEQFFRAPEGRGPSVPGTGLGLAIARSIVLAHGGAISVSNRPEGGARFSFSLPLAVPTAPQPPASDQPTTVST